MISYKHHLWGGVHAYKNFPGNVSRVRVKKHKDGDEIANLDFNTSVADLTSMDDAAIQAVIDAMIAADEAKDDAAAALKAEVIPPVDEALSTKIKKIKTKSKKV